MPTPTFESLFTTSWGSYESDVGDQGIARSQNVIENGTITYPTALTLTAKSTANSSTPLLPSAKRPEKRITTIIRLTNLALMSLVLMGFGMCASLFAPFFPTEAARRGVSATTVGLIFGSFTLVMFVGSFAAASLVRHLGLKFMIWSGTLLAGGSTVLFGLLDRAPSGKIYVFLCFLVRFVEGIGGSLYNTAAYSTVAVSYPHAISTNYAILETASGVGRMIGPTLGGVLFSVGGFSLPFFVVGAMLLIFGFISTALLQCALPDNDDALITTSDSSRAGEHQIMSDSDEGRPKTSPLPWSHFYRVSPEIWILTITLATSSIILGYPQPTMSLYFEQLGLTNAVTVGLIFLGASLAYTLMALIAGKLADTFHSYVYHMMAVAAIIISLGSVFTGPAPMLQSLIKPSVGLSTSCFIIIAFAMAMIINPAPSAITDAARSAGYEDGLDTSAMVAGLYNGMWFLGSFAGTPIAGFLMDYVGFEWGAFVMAILAFGMFVLLVVAIRLRKNLKSKPPLQDDYYVPII